MKDDLVCPNYYGVRIRCTVEDGMSVWKGVDASNTSTPRQSNCPAMSVPWRVQFTCQNKGEEQCYETRFDTETSTQKGAVCLSSAEDKPLATPVASTLVDGHVISHDIPTAKKEIEDSYVRCIRYPLGTSPGTMVTMYVPPGDRASCDELQKDALSACSASSSSENCDQLVENLYVRDHSEAYRCKLDTRSIPVASKKQHTEWWRWNRLTQYECKSKGWKCTDAEFSQYEEPTCSTNDTCTAGASYGKCVAGKCVASNSGAACRYDEECDEQFVKGECTNGSCSNGENNKVGIAYFAPKECSMFTDEKDGKYTYCGLFDGETGQEYSGYCQTFDYDGYTHTGCKAFSNVDEIRRVVREEIDYAHEYKINLNKHRPWQKLQMCPASVTSIVNGQPVCRMTVDTIYGSPHSVLAEKQSDARLKCNANMCTEEDCTPGLCYRSQSDGGRCHPKNVYEAYAPPPSTRSSV